MLLKGIKLLVCYHLLTKIDNSIYQFTNSNQNPNEKRLDSISKLSQIINNNSFYDYIKRNNYHHLVDIGYFKPQ